MLHVSIRARSRERAILCSSPSRAPPSVFQSAPARESGRYRQVNVVIARRVGFNPRPLARAGDTCALDADQLDRHVSIRARSRERAILQHFGHRHERQLVSIRARSRERAIRVRRRSMGPSRMFQSAPARESGRYVAAAAAKRDAVRFQSAPARESGRYQMRCRRPRASMSFNPRPLARAGDTLPSRAGHAQWEVSIRARSRERAIQAVGRLLHHHQEVSIRARSRERAILRGKDTAVIVLTVSIRARSRERAILPRPKKRQHS